MFFLATSLMNPDDAAWLSDHGYSHAVAEALTEAYQRIKHDKGSTASFLRAANRVMPYLKARMCNAQRLRVYFVLACAYAADENYSEALHWVDRALMLVLRLDAVATQIELLTLRATFNRAALLLDDALADRSGCLELLNRQREMLGIDDVATRLHTLSHLASAAFYTERYTLAEFAVSEVRALAPRVPHSQFDVAGAEWVQAHLFRAQHQPERTLRHMLSLREAYLPDASLASQARFEYFIAEAALEWAESLSVGKDRDALLLLARPHLRHAEQLAKSGHDYPGQALARLARVHYSRLKNNSLDRIATLESVVREGIDLSDIAIQVQATVALGDELTLGGARESGLTRYRQALTLLQGSQVPALAGPARRALLLDEEMHIG